MITIGYYDICLLIGVVLVVAISILIGYQIGLRKTDHVMNDPTGTFFINYNDPTKDLIRLQLNKDLPEIEEQSYILLSVRIEEDPPEELC